MDSNNVAIAAITLAGSICAGFFALLSKLSKSIDKMTDSNLVIAKEAEARNGHLANLVTQTAAANEASANLRQIEYRNQLNQQLVKEK